MRWLRPDEAALWIGVDIRTVYVIAHREQWRRTRSGDRLAYALDDVNATKDTRADRIRERKTPATAPTAPGHDRPEGVDSA